MNDDDDETMRLMNVLDDGTDDRPGNMGHWITDEHGEPVRASMYEWAKWFEQRDRRRVELTAVGPHVDVSTVFLGLDHSFGDKGPPILWETMIFGGRLTDGQWRYSSRLDAIAGHHRVVSLAESAWRGPRKLKIALVKDEAGDRLTPNERRRVHRAKARAKAAGDAARQMARAGSSARTVQ